MRTKEKFYKNLKGYISKKDRIQRLDLRDVKTLDGLSREAKKFRSALIKESDKVDDLSIKRQDAFKKHIESDNQYENQKDKVETLRKKYKSDIEKEETKQQKLFDKTNQLQIKADDAFESEKAQEKKAEAAKREASNFKSRFENAIKEFESSARALGVDVSNKVSSYKSIAEDVDLY